MHLSPFQSHQSHPPSYHTFSNAPMTEQRDDSLVSLLTSSMSVEDHILRSSTGLDSKRNRQRTSSTVTNPYEDFVPEDLGFRGPQNRSRSGRYSKYSPTPSIKRGKAEKLLKEHGSPPGIRVTAGGRIVPDGLSPISSPLFDAQGSFKQDHSNRLNLNFGYNAAFSAMPKPLNGFVVDVGDGTLCQFVDDELRAIEHQNGVLQLHMPAPNLPIHPGMISMGHFAATQAYLPFLPQPVTQLGARADAPLSSSGLGDSSHRMPNEREVRLMEQVHVKLEHELKDLDRYEVLQRALLNHAKRTEIVRTRVSLVNRIDESRRAIENAKKMLEDDAKFVNHRVPQSNAVPPSQSSTQRSVPYMNDHYTGKRYRFQETKFDPIPVFRQQTTIIGNEFQPDVPEFVPQQHIMVNESDPKPVAALQERSGNAGLGLNMDMEDSCRSTDTIKAFDPTVTSVCMNLDGSSHLPRRSHAIEIKKPDDNSARAKTHLNPASPSYQPTDAPSDDSRNSDERGEVLSFIPSPSLIAQMDNLLQSPRQQNHALDDGAMRTHRSSGSSATTADFFPHDAYQHSSKKNDFAKRDFQVNLPAWMPKDGEPDGIDTHTTPSRPPNKFVFNDESPSELCSPKLPSSRDSHIGSFRSGSQQPAESILIGDAPSSRWQVIGHQPRDPISTSHLLEEVSERAATLPSTSPRKTEAYWQGYRTGIQQDVLGDNKDEEYRIGYRDGLIHSSLVPDGASVLDYNARNQQASSSSVCTQTLRAKCGERVPSMTKATSFPSFGGPSGSHPPVPTPPANSLATTPTKYGSVKKERSPVMETPLDSPTARSDFMSQPNVNINAIFDRASVTKTSNSMAIDTDCHSPLTSRNYDNKVLDIGTNKDRSLVTRMQMRRGTYDQQRYQKSSTSVAQTNDYARAQFQSQYDGSADDGKSSNSGPTNIASPTTPSAKDTAKVKQAGLSPAKARASAAVATMKQVAGMGVKKDEMKKEEDHLPRKGNRKQKEAEPNLMSSPEKKKWRENWAKNFRQLRKDEQDEIETYKRENPIR